MLELEAVEAVQYLCSLLAHKFVDKKKCIRARSRLRPDSGVAIVGRVSAVGVAVAAHADYPVLTSVLVPTNDDSLVFDKEV